MTGLKDRQRLALYVALGLSAGSGLTLDASTAYANPDNHVTVLSTDPDFSTKYASGVNATNETSSVKDNVVTIGRKAPVDTPAINGDVVGGYSDAYAVTHNTVTVDDMTLALAKSVFGGLADGDKTADGNEVTINGGTYAGSNVVYGGKSDTGTATNNKVTINGGTYDGNNAVYGGRTSGTVATTGNEVIINGGHFGSNTDVYGGESAGGTAEGAAATGNTVTITGGVFDGGNIYGGNTTGTATTTRRSSDNKVYLGAENGAYSADLTNVNIRGAKDARTANKLFVRASGVTVGSLDNFDEYHFQLTQPTAGAVGVPVGSTMLAIGGTDGFGSNADVTMDSLHLDASGWDKDLRLYGNVGTVELVVANGPHLAIHQASTTDSMKRNGESGDFEYELTTDATATQAGSYVSAEVHRNRNADTTFSGDAAPGSEFYAGYSAYGYDAKNNHLRVTNVPSSTAPAPGLSAAYGAKIVGKGGSAHGNVLEITGTREKYAPHAGNHIANAYGAAITNAHNAGNVGGTADGEGNRITVSGGTVDNVYGGATQGTGAVVHNTATITGGTVTNVYGGHSTGDGTVASNEVHISRGTVGTASQTATVYGGAATGSGDVTGNSVTLTGGTVRGKVVAGAAGTGKVEHNYISLGDESNRNLDAAMLAAAELIGSEGGNSSSDNKLKIYAKNAKVKSVDHFTAYDFDLGTNVHDGDRMLTVMNAGAFDTAGNGVALDDISATTANLAPNAQNVWGRVTLIESGTSGTQLKFDAAERELAETNTHEFALHTDSGTTVTDKLLLDYNRYHGGKVVHDANTPIRKVGMSPETELYGGLSRTGHTTDDNELTINHLAADLTSAYGGKNEGAAGNVQANRVTVNGTTAPSPSTTEYAVDKVYGGAITNANNAGVVGGTRTVDGKTVEAGNSVIITGGAVHEVYGGYTAGTGDVQNNNVTIAGGTVGRPAGTPPPPMIAGKVYGGYSASTGDLRNNKVVITGGTIVGDGTTPGAVYGAYRDTAGTSGVMHGNVVELGNNDGAYTANLTNVVLYGDNAATPTDNDNTLNVRARDVKVKSVKNFDNYKFDLNKKRVTDGATMLTVNESGFGKEIDWNKLTYENVPELESNGDPGGRVTLVKGGTGTDALKFTAASFTGHEVRDLRTVDTDPNTNVEVALSTDSSSAETQAVLLTYAKFLNNTWTYDGAAPASANNEVFGGISYLKNDTTEKNKLTVTGVPDAGLTAVYGGKTNGDANSKGNFVLVQGTDQYGSNPVGHSTIPNVYGGYTAANYRTETIDNTIADKAGVAEENNVILAKGNVGSLYGGKVEGERGIAKNNIVVLTQEAEGIAGTVTQNTYGGVATGNAGAATGNKAIITAGTAHDVYGGMVSGGVSAGTPNKVSTADGNIVQMIGGSAANVYGGDALNAADGTASGNNVFVTGGTVNGNIAGARAKYNASNAPSKGNTVTFGAEDGSHRPLGATFAAGTTVYGTNYRDASGDVTFDGNDAAVKGNTLNVNAKNVTVGTVRNFEKFNFNLGDTAKDGDVMLSLTQAGGFGTTSGSPSAPVQVDWTKVKADTSHLSTVRGQGAHGKNTITLMRETASTAAGDLLNFANYTVAAADYSGTDRDYETKMHTDNNAASTESVVLELNRFRNDSVLHDGTTQPDAVYGGYSAYDDTAVDANGDHLGHTTENNMLGITGVASGTNNLKAYGGYAGGDHGGAVNNHVNVNIQNTTPGVLDSVYGGYASGAHAGVVRGNTATLDSGIIADILAGGYADSTGVDHNEVHINGGTVGTYIDPLTGSTVTHAAKVYGGYGATATDNTVEILAGTLDGSVYGGYATTAGTPATTVASPTAEVSALRNNKVTLRDGVTVTGNVYGAYAAADASNMTAATDSNTIDLYKAVIDGTIYGGMAQDGAGHDVVSGKNNTLAVHARGAKADDFVGVQNLHFYVPAGTTAADQETMLTLDNVAAPAAPAAGAPTTKDLSHVNVGVKLAGNRPSLKVGDAVSLMKVYEGNTIDATHAVAITSDTPLVNKTTGMQGVSLRYNFDLLTREAEAGSGKNNELYATVTSASVNPDTKSLAETRAASLAFLTSGSDLLTDAAMTAAMEVAATPASESQAGRARVDGAPKEYRMWAVQNVSSMRLNSGSHVDAKGWGLNLGFAKQRVSGRNTLTYGPFVEYGKGSYDSYLDDGLHGSGNMDYLGVGVMAKSQSENGAYVEGSVRVGRVKSDYAGTIDNTHTTYDSSSTYYAGHLGVGQEKQLKNGNVIDTYAKYFFTHQGGDTAKLSTGEVYDFDAADSHRIRFGTRYTSKKGDASFYTGLAYEYEFGNDIAASFEGYNTPSPSLTGGTGILELGYRFTPQNGRATYGIQLMGMTGKRRGISGGVQMHWAF